MGEPESSPNIDWLREFERRHGRPLRVLHIGNIANNAYNNAKIQRNAGIEADVICYDYYHIMGTPEWEDAEVEGDVGDAFCPDWWAVDLGGWQRPTWFIQGPILGCLAYLRAKLGGSRRDCAMARARLVLAYWQLVRHRQNLKDRSGRLADPFLGKFLRQTIAIAPEVRNLGPLSRSEKLLVHRSFDLPALIGPRIMGLGDVEQFRRLAAVSRQKLAESAQLRRAQRAARQSGGDEAAKSGDGSLAGSRMIGSLDSFHRDAKTIGYLVLRSGALGPMYLLRRLGRQLRRQAVARRPASIRPDIEQRQRAVREAYRQTFTHKPAGELAADLRHADYLSSLFTDVLGHYDIVQGYSTDGLIPLFAGVKNFTSYEHGTIRDIPFQDDVQGRLCRFTYANSPRVFVTNSDVIPSIPRIPITQDRIVYLPHAFNDSKLRAFRDANMQLVPPAGAPVFFSPTRHHWHDGDGSWLKGNDVFLKAAGRLAKEGRNFRLVLVEWGKEVAKSKALIEACGFAHLVSWVPTMTKRQLWKAYCESHVVVDQFTLPALGGVAFETLALGRRLITRIDEPTLAHFFGAAPPVLNAANVDEVAERMRESLADPDDDAGRGDQGRAWIQDYHSSARVIELQLGAYKGVLDSHSPDTERDRIVSS